MTTIPLTIPGLHIIIGLQGGGKSHLIRYIMCENRKKFNWGIVFSNTSFSAKNFDYIDERFVHASYDQRKLVALKNKHAALIKDGHSPSGFVIFDDCLFGKQWHDAEFLSLVTQLRHYNITCIISCQYPQAVPPVIRTNAFQVMSFAMGSQAALKAMYASYGQIFDSYEQFKTYMNESTGDHQFVMYDARNGTTTVAGRYSIMKAPATIPKFKVRFTGAK